MNTGKLLMIPALLATSCAVCADTLPSAGEGASDKAGWVAFTPDMAKQEYRNAYQHNRKYVQNYVMSYATHALTSIGIPETGVKYLGSIAGFAATRDMTLYLDDNRLFALELKDVTEGDASVLLGIKMDW